MATLNRPPLLALTALVSLAAAVPVPAGVINLLAADRYVYAEADVNSPDGSDGDYFEQRSINFMPYDRVYDATGDIFGTSASGYVEHRSTIGPELFAAEGLIRSAAETSIPEATAEAWAETYYAVFFEVAPTRTPLRLTGQLTAFGDALAELQLEAPDGSLLLEFRAADGETVELDETVVLDAGRTYTFSAGVAGGAYADEFETVDGRGEFSVRFAPVPEPGTLGLFTAWSLSMLRRRR